MEKRDLFFLTIVFLYSISIFSCAGTLASNRLRLGIDLASDSIGNKVLAKTDVGQSHFKQNHVDNENKNELQHEELRIILGTINLPGPATSSPQQKIKGDSLFTQLKHYKTQDTIRLKMLFDYVSVLQGYAPEKAQGFLNEAWELYNVLPPSNLSMEFTEDLGNTLLGGTDYTLALNFFNKLYDISESKGNKAGKAYASRSIGRINMFLGSFNVALKYYLESVQIYEEVEDFEGSATAHLWIGWNSIRVKDYKNSLSNFTHVLELTEQLNDQSRRADAYNALGAYNRHIKNYDEALRYHAMALEYYVDTKNNSRQAISFHNIARVYRDLKDYQLALDYGMKAINLKIVYGNKARIANTLILLGQICFDMGDTELGTKLVMKAIEVSEEIESLSVVLNGTMALSEMYEIMQDKRKVAHFRLKHLKLKDSLMSLADRWEIIRLASRNEIQAKERELNSLNQRRIEETKYRVLWTWIAILAFLLTVLIYFSLRSRLKHEKQRVQQQKKMDQMKSSFFIDISHELRTPLTLVLGHLEQINLRSKNEFNSMTQKAIRQIKNMTGMTNQILDLSRMESNQLDLVKAPMCLADVIQAVFDSFNEQAKYKKINYELIYLVDKDIWVNMDKERFEMILNNLISNAMKHCRLEESIIVCIDQTISTNQIKIIVKDTGPGIRKEDLPHIFERYYQSTQKNKISSTGPGLGLSIASNLVNLFEGTIEVKSKEHDGTTFVVLLPLQILEVSELDLSYSDEPKDAVEIFANVIDEPEGQFESKNKWVMIVEDHRELREFLDGALSPHYRTVTAANGAEALALLQSKECSADLVISDISMPVMDGFKLLQRVKADRELQKLPVIFLTARLEGNDKLNALRLGVDDYITKPFSSEELLVRCNNLLKRSQERLSLVDSGLLESHDRPEDTSEDILIKRVEKILKSEVANSSYSVDELAMTLNISKSTLFRRIKKASGLGPNQLIREIKLKVAHEKLRSGEPLSVAEVSFAVGIESPSYFSKIYQERYGKKPSSFLYSS